MGEVEFKHPLAGAIISQRVLREGLDRCYGKPVTTSFSYVTGTLIATIPTSYLTAAGTITVTVTTGSPGGGVSNSLPFTIDAIVPTPTFTPPAGAYATTQSVSIADTQKGVTIHYTTNGNLPTTSSPVYLSAIAVSATETIKAVAVASGYSNSIVAVATYTIEPLIPTPLIVPPGGSYTTTQYVSIADPQYGVTIYYTTDGQTPSTSSQVFSSAIRVATPENIKAIAVDSGYTTSNVASAAYWIAPVHRQRPSP